MYFYFKRSAEGLAIVLATLLLPLLFPFFLIGWFVFLCVEGWAALSDKPVRPELGEDLFVCEPPAEEVAPVAEPVVKKRASRKKVKKADG